MVTLLIALFARADAPAYTVARLSGVTIPGLPAVTGRITVDQFGYQPGERKVAVISDPQVGYNAAESYTPGSDLEVRDRKSGKTVFTGHPTVWNKGATDDASGDKGWWFDFSNLKSPGEYYVYDPNTQLRSPVFRVGEGVFAPVMRAATRMFYYQRIGVDLPEKYAGKDWTERAFWLQDKHVRNVMAKDDASQERDMSGGWMDAGDSNKYPPFNGEVVHPLLYAYRANPRIFGDANGIPESGNGLPDLLDELKYQLDWLVRMQFPDGSVPVKMGVIDYNGTYPLSNDKRPRYYGPRDSGAAIYTSAMLANAARVYGKFKPWSAYAKDLERRALASWNWFNTHPRTYKSDTGEIKSGIANRDEGDQNTMAAVAAIHLYALTGDEKYQDTIRKYIGGSRQLGEPTWSPYGNGAGEAFTDYLSMPKADPAVKARIKEQLRKSAADPNWAAPPERDLYRAYMIPGSYHWGGNLVRASWGIGAVLAARYADLPESDRARLRERAESMLHSFHGVNPLTVVYLSNMGSLGAENSIRYIYHERFNPGSGRDSNPPPGYLVGGPNSSYGGTAAEGAPSVAWVKEQPRGKAYADFNRVWPEASWELSEPANYYQAMYIRLLAEFTK